MLDISLTGFPDKWSPWK